jgi:predicted O-methyltransferase YrrM
MQPAQSSGRIGSAQSRADIGMELRAKMEVPEKHLFKARWLQKCYDIGTLIGMTPTKEIFYQNLFQNAASALGIPLPALYPYGGAANYSLLYTLMRLVTELPVKRVLEIGAGQSTLLLDAIARHTGDLAITTIENNEAWSMRVQKKVAHTILTTRLKDETIHGIPAQAFDLSPELKGSFDLILIDGPMGSKRHSRWSALPILDVFLADEFIVVFDDAGRIGEQDTIREFVRSAGNRKLLSRFVNGEKAQCLIMTEKYASAAYY